MVEKKKNAKKTVNKTEAKTVTKAVKKPVRVMVSEDALPAIDIAKIYNISTFDFFTLKKKTGINNETLLTVSEFRDKYQKAIKR